MSSFLCSDLHTAVCALATVRMGVTTKQARAVYSAFRSLNNASMARYNLAAVPARNAEKNLKAAAVYLDECGKDAVTSLFACLDYQCEIGSTSSIHPAGALLGAAYAKALEASNGHSAPYIWNI